MGLGTTKIRNFTRIGLHKSINYHIIDLDSVKIKKSVSNNDGYELASDCSFLST